MHAHLFLFLKNFVRQKNAPGRGFFWHVPIYENIVVKGGLDSHSPTSGLQTKAADGLHPEVYNELPPLKITGHKPSLSLLRL